MLGSNSQHSAACLNDYLFFHFSEILTLISRRSNSEPGLPHPGFFIDVSFRSLSIPSTLRTISVLSNFLDSPGVYLREELLLFAATPLVLLFSRRIQPGVARSAPTDRFAPEIPVSTDRLVWSSVRWAFLGVEI